MKTEYYSIQFSKQPNGQIYKINGNGGYVYCNKKWNMSFFNISYIKLVGRLLDKHEAYKELFLELL